MKVPKGVQGNLGRWNFLPAAWPASRARQFKTYKHRLGFNRRFAHRVLAVSAPERGNSIGGRAGTSAAGVSSCAVLPSIAMSRKKTH